ncbi:hypothetical protein LB467_12350 [Salegentibacter sp. JZCK2]|uniref:hypothetical protein n=1 Tax=Salegentibacter tibetensis TaxID=2873600 RepID=UPI001CCBF136|nr:hypothetical protein [Salegentibacter tibetensis]MBZ9730477.1 hypothetical protein [Salegentibacter tibetensis]
MKRHHIIFATIFLTIIGCVSLNNGLEKERIIFKPEDTGVRKTYTIQVPDLEENEKKVYQEFGGHGHGFKIVYADSSIIYYTNDDAIATPNFKNYETIGWQGFDLLNKNKDTVVYGQQGNGLFWKEIKVGEEFIGYLNVSPADKELFNKSIKTLK